MSKYVKDLITSELKQRLDGVNDLLLVDVMGVENNTNVTIRKQLRDQGIHLVVVKNSLARRATEGTLLAPAFDGLQGACAIVWGAEDVVSLAKAVTKLADNKEYQPFAAKGGVMDGARLSAEKVKEVSKWPSREEQLSILMGQVLSPGATLSGQLLGPGGMLGSQIKKKSEGEE
jgi:large subunit ribosomal protein L10